jgi:flagellar M-ring protein FliF
MQMVHMEVTVPQSQTLVANPGGLITPVELNFAQRVMALPAQRKWMLGGGIAALLAVTMAMAMWSRQADFKVLYTSLSDKDGGAILAQLQQMNMPYKMGDGGVIMVPADKVHDVRLKLASAGLPKGSVAGYELMEAQRFGVTQFQERLNFQRGLEGELTRSIQTLSSVESARVHLALPNQNGFFRDQQKASASVILTLYAGRVLDKGQVAGIVHLVSSSVPEMSPKDVSVVDQTGALVSGPGDNNDLSGLDSQQVQQVRQLEASYTQRIRDLLEPVVGSDNLRAQVTADVDFSQVESTAEEFKPNQNSNQAAIRSQQTNEQMGAGANGAAATGVPGAASNQPQAPATAPINGSAAPLQAAQTPGTAGAGGTTGRREAVTNYELDKTVRVVRNATGAIKRLTAAVVVNHVTKTDAKGKTTTVPLSAEELEKLTALVKETIGFSEQRGDSVKVINTPFKVVVEELVETPFWKQPDNVELMRTLLAPAALTLLALIVVFGAIRPAIQAAKPPEHTPEQRRLNAVVDDENELGAMGGRGGNQLALSGPAPEEILMNAKQLARENPVAMATLVRSWVHKDA